MTDHQKWKLVGTQVIKKLLCVVFESPVFANTIVLAAALAVAGLTQYG